MSKQNKKVPKKYQDVEDEFKFTNSKKSQNKNNQMEDTLEYNDADQTQFLALVPIDYPFADNRKIDHENNIQLLMVQKILGDYKSLLIAPFKKFWATLRFNLYLQDSLDLFLRFSPRQHLSIGNGIKSNHFQYWNILKDIYKSILWIYVRMVSYNDEDQGGYLVKSYQCDKILYDQWLIDIMKLTDIAQIYGTENRTLVNRIITGAFKNQEAYVADFKSTSKSLVEKVLPNIYIDLSNITNQSIHENDIFIDDLRIKMEQLTRTLDTIEILNTWIVYFPQQCITAVLNNVKAVGLLEQIFYEINFIRGTIRGQEEIRSAWKIKILPVNLKPLLNHIIDGILNFFQSYFEHVTMICLQVMESNDRQKISQLFEHISYILKNIGLNRRRGIKPKKGQSENDIKEWTLFDALISKKIDIENLLNGMVPWDKLNQFDRQEVDDILIRIRSYTSQMNSLRDKITNPKQDKITEEELLKNISHFNQEESQLKKLEEEYNLTRQMEEEEKKKLAYKQEDDEKLVPIISKKFQKAELDQSQEKRNQLAEIMSKIYEDEPDDTYFYDFDEVRRKERESEDSDMDDRKNKKILKKQPKQEIEIEGENYEQNNQTFQQNFTDQQQYQQKRQENNYQQQQYRQKTHQQQDYSDYENSNKQQQNQQQNNYNTNRDKYIRIDQKQETKQQSNQYQQRKDGNNEYNKNKQDNYENDYNRGKNKDYRNDGSRVEYKQKNDYSKKNDDDNEYRRNDEHKSKFQLQINLNQEKKVIQKESNRDGGYVQNVYKVKDSQILNTIPTYPEEQQNNNYKEISENESDEGERTNPNQSSSNTYSKQRGKKYGPSKEGRGYRNKNQYYQKQD